MKIEKLESNPIYLSSESQVTVKETGNQTEIKHSLTNTGGNIIKIDKDHYYNIRNGEIKEYNHDTTTRKDNKSSVKRTMRNLKDIINTSITDYKKALFITLTYRENMTDTKRLYEDVKKFHKRLKKYLIKENLPFEFEYISTIEVQR